MIKRVHAYLQRTWWWVYLTKEHHEKRAGRL